VNRAIHGTMCTVAAFYSNDLVGAIACRLEANADGTALLYIMTIGVLAPFRGLGIGERQRHTCGSLSEVK
jgi:ribosomal protein S18 acetylase RimI-like enzyme